MKKIKLSTGFFECEANRDKLGIALDEAQKQAKVRYIGVSTIENYCERIADIYRMIPKKHLEGCTFTVDHHAQNFPNAYKYRPESTQFDLLYHAGCFWVTDIRRDTTRRNGHEITANLTQAAKDALVKAYTIPTLYDI